MTKLIFICLLLGGLFMLTLPGKAQFYTGYSVMTGGNLVEEVNQMQVVNGETYILGSTRSTNFPVTNGTTYRGNLDMTLTRFNASGNIVYATYIGGLGNDFPVAMKIVDNEVFISLYTDSINFPVTNGTSFKGRRDVGIVKIGSTGNILFATYFGGKGNETPSPGALEVTGTQVIVGGNTSSTDLPITDLTPYQGGANDAFACIVNRQDGNLLSARYIGGNRNEFLRFGVTDSNSIYLIGSSTSLDIPVTIGSSPGDTLETTFITRLSFNNLNTLYSRYLGGIGDDFILTGEWNNGTLHLAGYTSSFNYPVTNVSTRSSQFNDYADAVYTRLNPDGQITFSTYLATDDLDFVTQLLLSNGNAYICGNAVSVANGQLSTLVNKVQADGSISYSRRYIIGTNRNNNTRPAYQVLNDEIYMDGVTTSPSYPVTNGSQFFSSGTGFLGRLNSNGSLVFSSYLGSMSAILPPVINNGLVYLVGQTNQATYPISNGSIFSGGADNLLIILRPDGSRVFSGYYGGNADDLPKLADINNGKLQIAGKTLSGNFPLTFNQTYRGSGDQFLIQIANCPTGYRTGPDLLQPDSQVVCKTGLGDEINGPEIMVPGDSLPLIYRAGVVSLQSPVIATYQWQTAFSPSGPWNDIPGAVFRSFTPSLGTVPQYYRRAAFTPTFCGASLVHYSDTVVARVNDLIAPVVNAGGTFITCPSFPVTIGGSPTVSGGNPPYTTYAWDPPLSTIANPEASPESGTVYTLTVTDSLGCKQIGQAVVLTIKANAGPDQGACGGQPAQIGVPAIPGQTGLQYNWQPSSSLNNSQIAQPQANPVTVTDYILTLTVPVSTGITCQTTDTVRVTPVNAPVTQQFAGSDKVFCLGSSVLLGTAAEAGFNYVWSPGSYLTSNTSSTTTYYAGNQVMPVPNPAVVNVTAQKSGCYFSDQTIVATIEARAGRDGCGPRIIGLPDRTPDINETYTWTKLSGSGNFTGPTNIPQTTVSASIDSATTYRLTVTYNGQSCTDDITVPPFCSNCQTEIFVDAQYNCPSYTANGGNVTLYATSSIDNAVFTWSPQAGLSNYSGNLVQLTDNVPRIYTVTARDPLDSTRFCSDQIIVNDPSFVRPVFPATDTITCAGQPVMIGATAVTGYSYQWTGNGLSSNLISNPIATISTTTTYPVTVTDIGGCILRDTVVVAVQNAVVNAGPDRILCSSGIVRLGTPAQPNTIYVWEPQTSPWQNNTNQFSAQPDVFVATDISFFVTATTSAGCIIQDTVSVSINTNPTIANAPDTSTCLGTAVRIGAPAITGVTYQWSPATGLNSTTVAQPLANPSATTTYTVIATFPGQCASPATDLVTVTVKTAAFNMPDISFCPDNGPVALGINAPPGMVNYSWLPAAAVSNAGIANPNTLNPPPKVPSNYFLLVTNPNGCQYRDTIQLIPTIAAPQAGPDRLICKGDSLVLGTAANNTAPGITYSWSPAGFLNDATSPTPTFYANAGGAYTYIVTKTDSNINCSSKDTVIITVQDIGFSMTGNQFLCRNSCVQVGTTPVTGITYQWSPATGLSDPSIANPVACVDSSLASYTLTASSLSGCRITQNLILSVYPVPAPQLSIPSVTGCAGDTTLQFNPIINQAGPYNYLWSPNDGSLSDIRIINPEIRVASPGNRQYQLQVTDTVSGCTNLATASLQIITCDPNVVIGDYVWLDINSNGLQDTGELGVSGVPVRLYNAAGFNIATTSTNSSGLYFFSSIPPATGYYALFGLPTGYMFTDPLVGGANADNNSKVNDTGRTINFSVPPGASVLNIDAGIKICGSGGPVPVTWMGFAASLRNGSIYLFWQTSSEYQNDYFEIERSIDGRNFESIGRKAGSGTTSIPHDYDWIDRTPAIGINYYRIRQVDFDGRSSYSRVIAIHVDRSNNILAVYDPAENRILINFGEAQPGTYAMLYNAGGQRITGQLSKEGSLQMSIPLPVLPRGVYTLILRNDRTFYRTLMLLGK